MMPRRRSLADAARAITPARVRAPGPPEGGSTDGRPSASFRNPTQDTTADPFADATDLVDLLAADLPEPEFIADGLLPRGLVILAAKPKSGKSWLIYQTAMAIVSGRKCLGTVPTSRRPVLYLALEDTRHRLRSRARKMIAGMGWTPSTGLTVLTSFPRAGAGGLARIAEWFADHAGGVVVIDTLQKFRDRPKSGGSYDEDYQACGELKRLADAAGGLVVVVHHTRKGAAGDPFDEVSGTLGLTGAADATLVMDRVRGENSATLYMTGRDLADATLGLTWDADHGLWTAGDRSDGIRRADRGEAADSGSDKCEVWLADFLAGNCWPDGELAEAAKLHGFTPWMLKAAKNRLRKREGGPRLQSAKRGFGAGEWWNWMGERGSPPPDRPIL